MSNPSLKVIFLFNIPTFYWQKSSRFIYLFIFLTLCYCCNTILPNIIKTCKWETMQTGLWHQPLWTANRNSPYWGVLHWNYGPVSNLPFICKVWEVTQGLDHLQRSSVHEMSGFRPHRQTTLVKVTNDLHRASDSGLVSVLFLLGVQFCVWSAITSCYRDCLWCLFLGLEGQHQRLVDHISISLVCSLSLICPLTQI